MNIVMQTMSSAETVGDTGPVCTCFSSACFPGVSLLHDVLFYDISFSKVMYKTLYTLFSTEYFACKIQFLSHFLSTLH